MDATNSKNIKPGLRVDIVQKQDQHSGRLTQGIVKDILTKSAHHPYGIKVRLETGEVGRVKQIVDKSSAGEATEQGGPSSQP